MKNDQFQILNHAIGALIQATGYTDFRMTNSNTDLVLLNPKASTTGNMDFISLNKEFLDLFRGDSPMNPNYTISLVPDMSDPDQETLGVEGIVPYIGLLMGSEVQVKLEGQDTITGTCSVITDIKELGHVVGAEANVSFTQSLNLYESFKDAMRLASTFAVSKSVEMKGDPRLPSGLEAQETERPPQVMGLYYIADRSVMGLDIRQFVDSVQKLCDDLTAKLAPDTIAQPELLAETLIIVEVLPGCRLNVATAHFNPATKGYIIDVVTIPCLIQVPDLARTPISAVECGYAAANIYRQELLDVVDNKIKELEQKRNTGLEAPVEVDGVIHFPKNKMS